MLCNDAAVADAPIVLETHQADAVAVGKFRCLRERKLAFRFNETSFIDADHGFGVATSRRFAPELRRAQRLHVDVADADLSEASGEHMLGKSGAARIGDLAHIDKCPNLCGLQRSDKIRNTNALVADGPDAAHCK